jgi:hypothetical protein
MKYGNLAESRRLTIIASMLQWRLELSTERQDGDPHNLVPNIKEGICDQI